ncbi:MAG: hypothetical protein EPN50_04090 [Chloroflexota bacterium]|nr:MAG: hypothetical protein EPN50_04090 [Chloroflexota bacterium]
MRAYPLLTHDFPLDDGGLFLQAVQGIESAGFGLPLVIHYNGLAIPFAYPPLGFYLAAALDVLTPLSLLDVFRLLPFVASLLTIPAFYLLAGEVLTSRFRVWLATFTFAVVPRGFEWMIVGGGVTRAPGFVFALLALAFGLRLLRQAGVRRGYRALLLTGLFSGLTALSHPEAALFVGLGLAVAWLVLYCSVGGLGRLVGAALVAAVVALPWWGTVLIRYGVGPLVSGGGAGLEPVAGFVDLMTFSMTGEAYFPVVAALGLLGLVWLLASRRLFLPLWFVLLFLLDARAAESLSMVPLAMMAAVGLVDVLLVRIEPTLMALPERTVWPGLALRSRASRMVLPAAQALMFATGLAAFAAASNPLFALSAGDRQALLWLRDGTPPSARVLVADGTPWFIDAVAEWLPALADRTSITTAQGYEWLGSGAFARQVAVHDAFTLCAYRGAACLASAQAASGLQFDYVYVPSGPPPPGVLRSFADSKAPCCAALQTSLKNDPGYRVVYDGPGALIAKVIRP